METVYENHFVGEKEAGKGGIEKLMLLVHLLAGINQWSLADQ